MSNSAKPCIYGGLGVGNIDTITEEGEVLTESEYRLTQVKREQKHAVVDLFAQAVVDKALEVERVRQYALRQNLEELCKLKRVKRMRAERKNRLTNGTFADIVNDAADFASARKYNDLREAFAELDESILDDETKREYNRLLMNPRSMQGGDKFNENPHPNNEETLWRRKSAQRKYRKGINLLHLNNAQNNVSRKNDGNTARLSEDSFDVKAHKSEKTLAELMAANQLRYGKAFLPSTTLPPVARRPWESIPSDATGAPHQKLNHADAAAQKKSSSETTQKIKATSRLQEQTSAALNANTEAVKIGLRLPPVNDELTPLKNTCLVQLRFLGIGPVSSTTVLQHHLTTNLTERQVVVEQQPSGTHTVCVFKDMVKPGGSFSFPSRRVPGFSFSLTIYVDGVQDTRISTCCEHRHRKGAQIGGKAGHFIFVDVVGSFPCYRCQAAAEFKRHKPIQPESSSNQSGDFASQTTVVLFGPSSSQGDEDFHYSSSFLVDSDDTRSTELANLKDSTVESTTPALSAPRIYLHLAQFEGLTIFDCEEEQVLEEIPILDVCEATFSEYSSSGCIQESCNAAEQPPTVNEISESELNDIFCHSSFLGEAPEILEPTLSTEVGHCTHEARAVSEDIIIFTSDLCINPVKLAEISYIVCPVGIQNNKDNLITNLSDKKPSRSYGDVRSSADTDEIYLKDSENDEKFELLNSTPILKAAIGFTELTLRQESILISPKHEDAMLQVQHSFNEMLSLEVSSSSDAFSSESLTLEPVRLHASRNIEFESRAQSLEDLKDTFASRTELDDTLVLPKTFENECRNDVLCGRIHALNCRSPLDDCEVFSEKFVQHQGCFELSAQQAKKYVNRTDISAPELSLCVNISPEMQAERKYTVNIPNQIPMVRCSNEKLGRTDLHGPFKSRQLLDQSESEMRVASQIETEFAIFLNSDISDEDDPKRFQIDLS